MDDDLDVGRGLVIPAAELEWRFTTSGGPGGQHANKAATRAELSWDVGASPSLDESVRNKLLGRLGRRLAGGVVAVAADDTRSQWRNRSIARRRLAELLFDALREEAPRRPTRPSWASRKRRLESKKRRGMLKRLRRPPDVDAG